MLNGRHNATRYTTSSFLRTKLGEALKHREVAPHVYETVDEARRHLHEVERTASSG